MPYSAAAAIGVATTLEQSLVSPEFDTIVSAASVINEASLRNSVVLPARKLEFPTLTCTVSSSAGHRFIDWQLSGVGRPIVWEGERAAPLAFDATTSFGKRVMADLLTDYESQRYINTIACLTVPSWVHSSSASPRWRLIGVSVSVVVLTNVPLSRATAPDSSTLDDDQDLASDLIVRAHRIPYSTIRSRAYAEESSAGFPFPYPRSADFVSAQVDAGLITQKQGMTARSRCRTPNGVTGNVPWTGGAYRESTFGATGPKELPGGGAGETMQSFQAITYIGGESIGPTHFLAPRDTVIVSLTGTDRVLFDQNAAPTTNEPNIVLPVRSHLVVATFESEFAA